MQSSGQIVTTRKATPSFLRARCPSCRPRNSVRELKGKASHSTDWLTSSSPGGLSTWNPQHSTFNVNLGAGFTGGWMMEVVVVSGDNWYYKTCKVSVKSSPSTNQHPVFYRPDDLHVAQPTVSEHWRKGPQNEAVPQKFRNMTEINIRYAYALYNELRINIATYSSLGWGRSSRRKAPVGISKQSSLGLYCPTFSALRTFSQLSSRTT